MTTGPLRLLQPAILAKVLAQAIHQGQSAGWRNERPDRFDLPLLVANFQRRKPCHE